MITYSFKLAFAPQLVTGEKTLTMRRDREAPSRHANTGEPIGLWTGMRTKDAKRQGVGLVTVRALACFDASGFSWVRDLVVRDALDPASAALLDELRERDADAFARRDGFENWAALWAWHDKNGRQKTERGPLVRHVIAWLPLNAEQIAAIDAGAARLEEIA